MSGVIARIASLTRRLRTGPEAVRFDGSVIPAASRRWCGPEFRDDAYFVRSAEREARRLRELGCGPGTRVLDIGCGYGRLAIGILRVGLAVDYHGLDVHRDSIAWCCRHLASRNPSLRFTRVDGENARYNPHGGAVDANFRLPVANASVDIAYLYSVASHLTEPHLRVYLAELARILTPDGQVFLTAFVEEGVPPVAENPSGYGFPRHDGPLHVVRYERRHLAEMIAAAGLRELRHDYGAETDGQTGLYLTRVAAPNQP